MKFSWIIAVVMIWTLALLCTLPIEMLSLPASKIAILQGLMQPSIPEYTNPIGAAVAFATVGFSYLQLMFTIVMFGFPDLYSGSFGIVQLFVFIPIGIAMIFTIVLIIRGVSSS